jgi:hypothetical protein
MSPEEHRILIAASEHRLRTNEHGRYVIDGEARPERKARENLQRHGFIVWRGGLRWTGERWGLSAAGESLLRSRPTC